MSRIQDNYEFLAGIHFDNELYFNRYTLKLDFRTNPNSAEDQNIAIDRVAYFIHEIVERSVFVNEEDIDVIVKYSNADITVLTVPSPGPVDQVVQATIITKVNAIIGDSLTVTLSEMSSTLGGNVTYIWDASDTTDEVHEFVNNSNGSKWWATVQPRFMSYDHIDDFVAYEKKTPYPLTWGMLSLSLTDKTPDDTVEPTKNNTVIKMSDFPKGKK